VDTDEFGWQESSDPLYKTIPFFIGVRNGAAYGVFFDNRVSPATLISERNLETIFIGAVGWGTQLLLFFGPHAEKVIANYTALVGRAPLPHFGP